MHVFGAAQADYLYKGKSFSHPEKLQNLAILLNIQNASYLETLPELQVNTQDIDYTLLHKKILKGRLFH